MTPSQAEYLKLRQEFARKIMQRAVPDTPITIKRPPPGIDGWTAERMLRAWAEQDRLDTLEADVRRQEEENRKRLEALGTQEPTIFDIMMAVEAASGVSRLDLLSDRRTKTIVPYRFLVWLLAKKLTLRSLPEIGRVTGGKDHTSIMHGLRRTEYLWPSITDLAGEDAPLLALAHAGVAVIRDSDLMPKGKNYRPMKPRAVAA